MTARCKILSCFAEAKINCSVCTFSFCSQSHLDQHKDQCDRVMYQDARRIGFNGTSSYPICIICRTPRSNEDKRSILSHIIPRSVLNSSLARDFCVNMDSGETVSANRCGYRGYCHNCEEALNVYGETTFNPTLHKPLVENLDREVRCNDPRLFHCFLSVAWRTLQLCELAGANNQQGTTIRRWLDLFRPFIRDGSLTAPEDVSVQLQVTSSYDLEKYRHQYGDNSLVTNYGGAPPDVWENGRRSREFFSDYHPSWPHTFSCLQLRGIRQTRSIYQCAADRFLYCCSGQTRVPRATRSHGRPGSPKPIRAVVNSSPELTSP
jgi:hypothetical protein